MAGLTASWAVAVRQQVGILLGTQPNVAILAPIDMATG
jgi:hypothetical protein